MKKDNLQSDVISFLRFPLILGVVLIHSQINEVVFNGTNVLEGKDFYIYKFLSYLFSQICASIAVPLFFFISGFLFFFKSNFNLITYRVKLRKRTKTLLIPYLIWNLLTLLMFLLLQIFFPLLTSGVNKNIVDYSFVDWISAFWSINQLKQPIAFQFWFIRDLMIMTILSPLLFLIIKYLKVLGIVILGLFWIIDYWFIFPGFSIVAFFFFSIGAWFSINRYNFVLIMKPLLLYAAMGYCAFIALEFYFINEVWVTYIHNIGILVGCVFVIALTAHMLELKKWKINTFLVESCFFIYAYHAMALALVIKLLIYILRPTSDLIIVCIYFLCPTITVLLGLLVYRLLKKLFPSLTTLIIGGR